MAMERSLAAFSFALFASIASAIVLVVQAQQNPGFISIDCGATIEYLDSNTSITYKTDEGFVDSGNNAQVSTDVMYTYDRLNSRTLRIFPNGTRNCYTLGPDQGKNRTYLIRATFWYGNYDKKNQPPSFDLYIDVNYWVTVNRSDHYYEDIMYTSQADDIQVCLVNTGHGVPFISALELRALDDDGIYRLESGFLQLQSREDIGLSLKSEVRHPDDHYDRIWIAVEYGSWITLNTTSAIDYSDSNDAYKYKIPEIVLQTAQVSADASFSMFLRQKPSSSAEKWIVYFYFVEIERLTSGQQREFTVSLNDNQFTETVSLEYLKPVVVVSPPVNGSLITCSIISTNKFGNPPILNAVEFYTISDLPNVPTAQDDVKALINTKAECKVNKDSWQGDPCVPSKFAWDGLNCSYGNPPRVILLNLSSSNLRGIISSSLSSLSELESLDLSNNQLTGAIPENLANLPKLRILNLSGNKLNGSVPEALKRMHDDKKLDLRLDNNPDLCQKSPCPKKEAKNSNLVVVIASVSVIFVVICVLTVGLIRWKQNMGMAKLKYYSSGEISRIINKAPTIGEGAFGKVYLGTLEDGKSVAVKVLSKSSWQGLKEFQAELRLSTRAHHGNLVSLLGYCDHRKRKALVYEYMANGNLEKHLIEKKPNVLTWSERLQIALGVAEGLQYLHNGCDPPIIHRDLKTSNILLSEKMVAKISDFGLSRDFTAKSGGYASSTPLGTAGYISPEYREASKSLDKKSDVYSFGIVLFELITGHPAVNKHPQIKSVEILEFVTPFVKNGNNTLGLMDPSLGGKFDSDSARKAIKLADLCTRQIPAERPDISVVLSELKASLQPELASEKKPDEGKPNEQLGTASSGPDPNAAAIAK